MRETRSYGSVRGAAGNSRPYREPRPIAEVVPSGEQAMSASQKNSVSQNIYCTKPLRGKSRSAHVPTMGNTATDNPPMRLADQRVRGQIIAAHSTSLPEAFCVVCPLRSARVDQ